MEPEVAKVVAEVNLSRQHKYRNGWNKADQRDENQWTIHDNEHARQYGFRYATCPLCWPKEDNVPEEEEA